MKQDSAKFDLLKRYLLSQLPEDQMQSIEQQYLADEIFFDELLNAETELIAQHLGGQLSPEESERFNDYFLGSDERCKQVEAQTKLIVAGALPVESGFKKWGRRWLWRLGLRRFCSI